MFNQLRFRAHWILNGTLLLVVESDQDIGNIFSLISQIMASVKMTLLPISTDLPGILFYNLFYDKLSDMVREDYEINK